MSDHSKLNQLWNDLNDVVVGHVKSAADAMFWTKVGLILVGGAVATGAQFMPEPAEGAAPWKILIGVGGAAAAFLGGALVAVVERKTPEMISQARRALDEAQRYLGERDSFQNRLDAVRQFDGRRRALLSAWASMCEAVETQMLRTSGASVSDAINAMFDSAIALLLAAIGIATGESYVISVFRKTGPESSEIMTRLAERRSTPAEQNGESRSWKIGEGFTGMAWLRSEEVVVRDAMIPDVQKAFFVPPEGRRADEYERYRSVAAVPILIGPANDVWGVVTVTSNRAGRFGAVGDADSQASVEAVKAIAAIVALLAGIDRVKGTLTEQDRDQSGKGA